jgi:hypothetical protein
MVSNSSRAQRGFFMDQQENIKDRPEPSSGGAAASAPIDVTAKMALASLDLPKIDIPKIEVPKIDIPKIEAAKIDAPKLETPKIELDSVEAPRLAPEIDEIGPPEEPSADASSDAYGARSSPRFSMSARPMSGRSSAKSGLSRFTLLAAALALAAALGGLAGALAAASFVPSAPVKVASTSRTGIEEFQALKENVVQARVELAALKASFDAGNRNASAQLTKIGERIDRIERSQAEPAAKLNKAIDALDRMSRADASPAKDITGSIAPAGAAAAPPAGKPSALDGWVVRDVRRGTALIEGRLGLIEVDQGDMVPGLGRIDAIRKQDGRWVVVTTRGLIMPPR